MKTVDRIGGETSHLTAAASLYGVDTLTEQRENNHATQKKIISCPNHDQQLTMDGAPSSKKGEWMLSYMTRTAHKPEQQPVWVLIAGWAPIIGQEPRRIFLAFRA